MNCSELHVALLVERDGTVFTSDEPDIKALLKARQVKAVVVRV
jgi:hypothetical protein